MLLVLDTGNTTTVIGIYDGTTLMKSWRLVSERHTSDELGIYLLNLLTISGIDPEKIDGAIYSSVVPSLDTALEEGLRTYLSVKPIRVTCSLDLGIPIAYSPSHEVGADRLVNAVAGKAAFGAPLIVVDLGTAITLDILDRSGAYLGGTISPGLVTGMEALFGRTAKLPQVSLEAPKSVIGNNTIGSIQAGILFGNAGLVDSLVRRIWSELGTETPVIATGGHAAVLASLSETITSVAPLAHPGGTSDHLREEPAPVTPFPPVLRGNGTERSLSLGGLMLSNPLLLAPLAGVTIPSLRLFFSRLGAGAVHTEMVSSAGLLRSNRKTASMLKALPGEAPLILQLFAGDGPTLLAGAERSLGEGTFAALGINMACPMPKVLKKGAGSRLLERPEVAFGMVRDLALLGLPVWPKIRKCPPSFPLSTEAFCEGLLNSGASLVSIHGRTPAARYSGEADRTIVGTCAALFPEKICASGDVYTPEGAAAYLQGGCAAVMLARGALADPFLFARTLAFLGYDVHNSYRNPSPDFQMSLLLSLGDLICAEEGQGRAVLFLKRLLAGMFKGEQGIGALRRAAAHLHVWPEVRGLLMERNRYFERRE